MPHGPRCFFVKERGRTTSVNKRSIIVGERLEPQAKTRYLAQECDSEAVDVTRIALATPYAKLGFPGAS
jgi:hypothetical protein